jgi:2-oxoisovalerate dehydrogenase E1 component alpha subunit
VTYRMGPHTTADDPTRYRDQAELEQWGLKDPISRLEALLVERGVLDEPRSDEVAKTADAVAARLRAGCISLTDPDPLTVFDNVYSESHPALARQRDHYSRYLQTFVNVDSMDGVRR